MLCSSGRNRNNETTSLEDAATVFAPFGVTTIAPNTDETLGAKGGSSLQIVLGFVAARRRVGSSGRLKRRYERG